MLCDAHSCLFWRPLYHRTLTTVSHYRIKPWTGFHLNYELDPKIILPLSPHKKMKQCWITEILLKWLKTAKSRYPGCLTKKFYCRIHFSMWSPFKHFWVFSISCGWYGKKSLRYWQRGPLPVLSVIRRGDIVIIANSGISMCLPWHGLVTSSTSAIV